MKTHTKTANRAALSSLEVLISLLAVGMLASCGSVPVGTIHTAPNLIVGGQRFIVEDSTSAPLPRIELDDDSREDWRALPASFGDHSESTVVPVAEFSVAW